MDRNGNDLQQKKKVSMLTFLQKYKKKPSNYRGCLIILIRAFVLKGSFSTGLQAVLV